MKRARFEAHDGKEARIMSSDGVLSSQETPLQYRELHLSSQDNVLDFGAQIERALTSSFTKSLTESLLLEQFIIKNVTIPYSWYDVPTDSVLQIEFSGTSLPAGAFTVNLNVPRGSYEASNIEEFDVNGNALLTSRFSSRGICGVLNRELQRTAVEDLWGTTNNHEHFHFLIDSKTRKLTLASRVTGGTLFVRITDNAFARYLGFASSQLNQVLDMTAGQFLWYPHLEAAGTYYTGFQATFAFLSCPFHRVVVRCPELSNAILSRGNNNGHQIQGVIGEVPIDVPFGGTLVKESNLMSEQKFVTHGARLNRLTFDLLFTDGRSVDLNGDSWGITIGIWFRRNVYADHY